MRETLITAYFLGDVSAVSLKEGLQSIRGVSVLRKGENFNCDLSHSWTIKLHDLKMVCDDFLNGVLDAKDVESMAFFMLASDHFEWDNATSDGAAVAELIDDWASSSVAYPINKRNMKMISRDLEEGVYDSQHLGANQRGN